MTVALANGSINYETFNAIFALYAETSEDQDSMYTSLSAVMDPWGNIEQENYVNSDDIFSFFAGDENQKYIQFNISGNGISVTTLISSDLVNDDFKGEMQGFMPSGGDVSASVDNENGTLTLRLNNAINIFQFQTIQSDYNKKYNDNNQFGFTIEMDPVVENIFGYGSINLEGKTNQAPFTELRLVADNYETSHIYASDDTIYYEDDHKMYYTDGIYFNKDVSMYLNSESDYYLWVRTGTSSSGWRSYSFKLPAVTIYSPQWSLGYSDGDSALIYSPVDYNTINNINKISCNYKDSGSYVFNWSVEVSETLSSEETRVRNCTMQYTVEVINLVNIAPPKLAQQDSGNGVVQYLDFNGGTFSDGSDLAISPLRLNTLFAMTLINKANIGIDELLTWDTQLTEEPVGFGSVIDYPVDMGLTPDEAISNATTTGYLQQLATIGTTDMFSWMGGVTQQQADHAMKEGWRFLQQHHLITFSGHIRSRGRVWAYQNRQHPLAQLLADAEQIPIHSAVLTADNYPETTDPDDSSKRLQQTGITVGYSDGFGRAIQLCALVPEGDAWHREDGGQVDTTPIKASERWVVSGRTEYDNKGQPVRSYQPYFLDSWLFVTDDSIRTNGYSDTLYYDALGRNIRTVTAKGYLRCARSYSWFSVAEDENDTAELSEGVRYE
ncbi:hypothetical protein RIV63_000074 [Salmonella enterica]|nr:hypothetical protein [Salmonella enterica]